MNIKWLVEINGADADNAKGVANAVRLCDMKAAEVKYIPMSNDLDRMVMGNGVKINDNEPVVAFTSLEMVKLLQSQRPQWFPSVWCDGERFSCHAYYAKWGEFSVQKNYAFMPLSEIKRRKEWVYKTFSIDGKVFIRPDDNFKSFTGEVVHEGMFDKFYDMAGFYGKVDDKLAIVSSPVKIHAEWRFIIADNKVLTGSTYRIDGKVEKQSSWEPGAAEFAETVAVSNGGGPHRIYVMDICRTDEGYRLMEIGPVNAAGLYACNLIAFVQKASEIALEEWTAKNLAEAVV